MYKNRTTPLILLLFVLQFSWGQQPQKPNSAEIYNQIQKLNFLGSVLYIAAHPDDENTKLISYFSNEKKARTAYLSLTRGDGGQNLIGPELRELLGVIRTQELIEARKIDGGEQFFSRANDFGYSKTPKETLQIWDKNQVLADVIWTIRKFQPDVIINRFDHRTSGNTHGHHSASAILSVESFNLSNSTTVFPEQLQYVQPWQVKRQFFNPSYWFYGSQEKFNAADKSSFSALNTGVYYTTLGNSNQEIAALSRSCHQSQGFGTTGSRGDETEYLEQINGAPLKDKSNIFEGIDTSWNRVKGGKPIGELLSKIIAEYNFNNPSASVPHLIKVYQMLQSLDDSHWKTIKSEDIKNCILNCAGLYLEAVSSQQEVTPGSLLKVKIEATNRSTTSMELISLTTLPNKTTIPQNKVLANNQINKIELEIQLPKDIDYTQPYWLKESGSTGMYTVSNQQIIGIPDVIRETKIGFNIKINGFEIPIERTIVFKQNSPVKGEMYQFLDITPEVTTSILNNVSLFNSQKSKTIAVKVKSGIEEINGILKLELPENWLVSPKNIAFDIKKKGAEKIFYFDVTPPLENSEVYAKSIVQLNNKQYSSEQITIDYPHITKQQVLKSATAKFLKLDLKIGPQKIGYIMGAGDAIPESLLQMGYDVILLKPEEISTENLRPFDVIITGIRAYNVVEDLVGKQQILFNFVKEGKTMLVQYNTPSLLAGVQLAPYPLTISSDRVTEQDAEVRFLSPNHAILNYPNKITANDFKGWTQEQGLYYPNEYDPAFTPILSSNDADESPKNGSLLVASYGKGYYIYTGLSFFRELPEGVSGAYRLMSNIISLQNNAIETVQNKP
ncbi:PIG-L family deacetylase [Flavobacterium sp. NG2]|uniref:PIG-L family deacetylase n=1 Tax=Flavobacterium sp. NG2 TaxID=3097547 RepID=UPI002A7F85C8|nr:PIG-L family deacetylase [Flavobacterium sp. NG2]WPR72983.1 PIG-L family deacetylase [Flavobacterium sp. NG2]